MPDTIYQDSSAGAYPLPLNNGVGGLAEFPACINEPYDLVFTVKLDDSLTLNGLSLDVFSAQIETTGAVEGLPAGLNYLCNPPDCIFPDSILGCIVVTGIPSNENTVGEYPLKITGSALLDIVGTFPGLTFPGILAEGSYSITLNEEGNCVDMSTSVNYLEEQISLTNMPNPVQSITKIEMTSLIGGDFQFTVLDMTGRVVQQRPVQLQVGYNAFQLDVSEFENGMYLYTLSDGKAMIFEKMIVER